MDRETVEEIKRHLAKTVDDLHGHVDKTVGELHAHFDETVEDMKRQFGTFGESLRSDMRVIAEGQDIVRQRLGGLEVEVRDLKGVVQRVHSELTGGVNDHERRLATLERKPAKGR
jgi:hypothetical protein